MKVLHASHNQSSYCAQISTEADLAALIRDNALEAICAHHRLDFWTTPLLRPSCINKPAVKMLLATSDLRAHEVPLLRGSVVIATHDEHGHLSGLTDETMHWLADLPYTLSRITDARIEWRIWRAERARRRRRRADRAYQLKHWSPTRFLQ